MPDVFTPLKQLIFLSLNKNQWSCTCDLHPLARVLRNYINSSAHTLRNAKDLNCQPSTTAMTTAKSVLRLSEINCDAKAPNHTMVLKDRSPILPGQDVTLLTVLGFAGAVGLTCLGLVVLNWKLQKGKANEHTSENLCCRTFDESLCAHEARNHRTKLYCNCHLTQENRIKVMSIVGARKEMPLLQENSHQATLAPESTALDRSFRNLKGKDHGADNSSFCLDGRLLRSGCTETSGDKVAFNEPTLLTRCCPERVKKLRNCEPGEVQPQTLSQHVTRTIDISSDTFSRRYATSASALAKESLEKHLTNESWQPPIEKEDNALQPHRQRHLITSSSSKPFEPEEHYGQKITQKHRLKYDDPCGLLKWSRPTYFQPYNSLICKYVPCDQFQDYVKEKKPRCRYYSKPEKWQIQTNSAIEKFLTREDNVELSGLSAKAKKTYSPKRVSFQDPELVGKGRLVMSPKTATHWKQQKNQSNQRTSLDLKKRSNLWERNARGKWFTTDEQLLKKKRINPSDLKGKIKGHNLRIKLNLHPFRKVRVHPEQPSPELQGKCKHALLSPKKLSKASEKKAKINLVSSADFPQQPEKDGYIRLISKRLPLKHAPKQIPSYQKNTKNVPLLSADNLSVVSQSSMEGKCHPTGHIPDINPSTLPLPTLIVTEHRHSYPQLSREQMEATHLALEVPGHSLATWENTRGDILPSYHSWGAIHQRSPEPPEHMEQDRSKTSESRKANQFSSSLKNQIQLPGVQETDAYNEQCTSDQNQALRHGEQKSSHTRLGNEERTPMTEAQTSHHIVESCIRDEVENDVGENLPRTETYDSSFIPQTQPKSNVKVMKINSVPYKNRIELSKDTSTSPFSHQAIWHLTNSSKKGTDSANALPSDDSTEALEIKIVGGEENKILHESKTNSGMLIRTTQVTSKGTTEEKQKTWENGKSEKHLLYDSSSVKATITAKDVSITSSHENENQPPGSEIDLQTNNNVYDLRKVKNIQPDTDNSVHKEGEGTARTAEKREVLSPSPELKDINFEAENEVLLIPTRRNGAEDSAPKPALYLPSAEYANTSPFQAEQSEQNNSNNIHSLR